MTIESSHPAPRVMQAIAAEPWAILPGALELIIEIASRRGDPEAVAAKRGAPLDGSRSVTVRDGVAVLPITGPIFPRASLFAELSTGATSVETMSLDFQTALDDPAVSAIVLHIDSPGGQVSGVQEFAARIAAARGVKPITAYVGGTGASAAYWIAAAADRIVAAKTAMLGSIGVVATLPKADGKSVSIVSTRAPKKRVDPETDDGRAEILMTLDDVAGVFTADVAAYRGTTPENVEQHYGQGGVLVGARAVAAGLADALGSLEGVIAELSALRPLAGNLNAMEETMPNATKPDAGGGTTAATIPADPNAAALATVKSPVLPVTTSDVPLAADVLALVDAFVGPEAAATVTQAIDDAQASGVPCAVYAAMAKKFGAVQAKTEATPTALQALTAALATPAGPGTLVGASDAEAEHIRNAGVAGANARSGQRSQERR